MFFLSLSEDTIFTGPVLATNNLPIFTRMFTFKFCEEELWRQGTPL